MYMTFTNIKHQVPKSVMFQKPLDSASLLVKGQGVVFFDTSGTTCELTLSDGSGTSGIKVHYSEKKVLVTLLPSKEPLVDVSNTKGLVPYKGAYYWFSLDSQNQRLYAGIGEARKETVVYTYQWNQDANHMARKLFLESLTTVKATNLQLLSVLRDPITRSVPLIVKDKEELTMDMLASGIYLPSADLSPTSQRLYNCMAGPQFILDTDDFPEFSRAIEYSIATPGKWCYETLKAKATEFSKEKPDVKETYLRITLGENNGESPGIPYVMEIWPVGHYSPVHNHGGASAVIRVLHGGINVSLFPFLSTDAVATFAEANFQKGDITWISPSLNQVHQLKNLEASKDTCITIQCYMYEGQDTSHYDYFDYIDADSQQKQFEPNSDMDFVEFKKRMKKEWLETYPVPVKKSWVCF
jgi:hypothetical protein